MKQNNRVLNRVGARELTVEETECVSGSLGVHTEVCTRPFPGVSATVTGDGDACTDQ